MRLIEHPQAFEEGVRVLFLKGRYKDGIAKQRTITRITHDVEEHQRALFELAKLSEPNERIYGSADARDIRQAAKHFKMQMLEEEFGNDPLFFQRIERRWESALMQPTSRSNGKKLWLFDCDVVGQSTELLALLPQGTGAYRYATKNGEHVITNGFDRRLLPTHLEAIRSDNALMLWGFHP